MSVYRKSAIARLMLFSRHFAGVAIEMSLVTIRSSERSVPSLKRSVIHRHPSIASCHGFTIFNAVHVRSAHNDMFLVDFAVRNCWINVYRQQVACDMVP